MSEESFQEKVLSELSSIKSDVVRLIRNPPPPSVYPADYSQPAMDSALRAFLS